MRTESVFTDGIKVPPRLRQVDEATVARIADSMAEIGLQQPISVWSASDDHVELVAGAHRLSAAKKLGWEMIECFYVDLDETDRQLWEIDENLMRAELSATERAQHLSRRKELWEERKSSGEVSAQLEPKPEGGRPEGFASETSESTGLSKPSINRDLSRAEKIPEDVMERITPTRLNTGVYMDALAKMHPGKDATDEELKAAYDQMRQKVERDLQEPEQPKAQSNGAKQRATAAEDRDLSEEAADKVAQIIAENVPGEHWDGLKANLYQTSSKQVAKALTRLTGVSVFDNTDAGRHDDLLDNPVRRWTGAAE